MKAFDVLKIMFIGLLIMSQFARNKDESSPEGTSCLLTRITKPGGETGGTITHIIEYNNQRKPVRFYEADNPFNYVSIEWDGDQLTKVTKYLNNALSNIYTYTRNGDTLNVLIETFYKSSYFEKIVYTLDENERPIKEQWYWKNSDGDWESGNYFLYFWENDNLVRSEQWFTDKIYTKTYEYDNKNNAYASLGLFYGVEAFSRSNIVKEIIEYNNGGTADITTFEYIYNEEAFPIKLTKTFSNNTTEDISFEYKCN